MKKINIWVFLAIIYIFVIGLVVYYRIDQKTNKTIEDVVEVITTPSPSVATGEIIARFDVAQPSSGWFDVALFLVDPASFEFAGYTLEISYDPAVMKIIEVNEGDVWHKNIVLQKDLSSPGKILYSLGAQFQSSLSGGNVMTILNFQVIDENATTTEISLGQISKSAGDNSVKTIVAQPLTIKLK